MFHIDEHGFLKLKLLKNPTELHFALRPMRSSIKAVTGRLKIEIKFFPQTLRWIPQYKISSGLS
jgi:hypothetical protein